MPVVIMVMMLRVLEIDHWHGVEKWFSQPPAFDRCGGWNAKVQSSDYDYILN